ncbi:Helix-turn-helix [Sphingobium sp. AP50]|uniref:helix-turn-helix domain-containing protein n=1 Tax=Sphingobium sp. AP50 TaxID=1884369 RepID=UPI0008B78DC0|nr:helix-turn-helix transcriptional regulator [Sphingobium sp. AP50]SEJ96429.1 Helix-turn-helix [Sphingobium sp. AP50]
MAIAVSAYLLYGMTISSLYGLRSDHMPATTKRIYGRYTREAITLLGRLVLLGRRQKRMTAELLAERIGVSRGTLRRLENGDPKVEIGVYFEAAAIVGIELFESDLKGVTAMTERTRDRLAVLPKYVRENDREVDDDF